MATHSYLAQIENQSTLAPNNVFIPTIGMHLEGHSCLIKKARIVLYLRASYLLPILYRLYPYTDKFITKTFKGGSIIHITNLAFTNWHICSQMVLGWVLNSFLVPIIIGLYKFKYFANV